MYYKDILDSEVVQFHKGVRVNARLEEVLSRGSSGDLPFIVKTDGGVNKAVPLFYSDSISSDYGGVRVLDNQCLFYTGDLEDYPEVWFESTLNGGGLDLIYTTSLMQGNRFLSVHLFDKSTLFGLSGVSVTVAQYKDETLVSSSVGVTDHTRGLNIELTGGVDKIIFTSNGQSRTVLLDTNVLILTVNRNSFTMMSNGLVIGEDGGTVDYGDGNTATLNAGNNNISHAYSDGVNGHTVIVTGVTGLGSNCFANATALTSIQLPESLTSLGQYCFYKCTGLTSISLPEGLTSIGQSCFSACGGLTSISLPESLTSLGNYCFQGCTGLTSIVLNWSEATDIVTYNSNWIYDANGGLKFSIPHGTTSLYTGKGYPAEKLVERGA